MPRNASGTYTLPSGNPVVDVLQQPTPARVRRLLDAAAGGELTKEHIQGGLACELATVALQMASDPSGFKEARMGYSIRRDLLTKLLESSEATGGGAAAVTVVVHFPTRFYGPQHGDQVKTGKGAA
jgi:hypothetical protein